MSDVAIERDDIWFCDRPERRFRLRPASEQEAERIGAGNCMSISTKGGAIYTFATDRLPSDSDASLSTFLHHLGYFHRTPRKDTVPAHRMVSAR
jgi:hypothetical protein